MNYCSRRMVLSIWETKKNKHRSDTDPEGAFVDMYTELQRDDEPHDQLASQDDMDRF